MANASRHDGEGPSLHSATHQLDLPSRGMIYYMR